MSGSPRYLSGNLTSAGLDNLAFAHAHVHGNYPIWRPAGHAQVPVVQGYDQNDELVLSLRQMAVGRPYEQQMTHVTNSAQAPVTFETVRHNTGRRLSTDSSASVPPPPYLDAILNLQHQHPLVGGQRSSTASYSSVPPSYADAMININSRANIPGIHGQRLVMGTVLPAQPAEYSNGGSRLPRREFISGRSYQQPQTGSDETDDEGGFTVRATRHNYTPNLNYPNNNRRDTAGMIREEFTSASVRKIFARQVFAILMVQFITSSQLIGFILRIVLENKNTINFRFSYLIVGLGIIAVALTVWTYAWEYPRKKSPQNLILLVILTLSYTAFGGSVTAFFEAKSVVYAMSLTAGICSAFVIFSLISKRGLTYWSSFFVLSVVFTLIVSILLGIRIFDPTILPPIKTLTLAFLLAIGISTLLICDVIQIMNVSHKYVISPEEIIHGVIAAYIDIIMIFMIPYLVLFCRNVVNRSGRNGGFDEEICMGVCFDNPAQIRIDAERNLSQACGQRNL